VCVKIVPAITLATHFSTLRLGVAQVRLCASGWGASRSPLLRGGIKEFAALNGLPVLHPGRSWGRVPHPVPATQAARAPFAHLFPHAALCLLLVSTWTYAQWPAAFLPA